MPFFSATLSQRQAARRPRLWQAADAAPLTSAIDQADDWADDWGDAFDVDLVRSIWRRASAGGAAARDELLLQRVVWRGAFARTSLGRQLGRRLGV